MDTESQYAQALAALGHDARLKVFRLLVKAGKGGLGVGEIGQHTGLAASTLAHHLRMLVAAGLVLQQKNGREVRNTVDFPKMREVLDFLTSECCAGVQLEQVKPPPAGWPFLTNNPIKK
ncbi:MAG: helix-turn-helix transcriptional regulator [Rhodobacteraceae bacterium]|nr:helix-turn-helix transcriptional regulator [Paracoccaceae bacterium]